MIYSLFESINKKRRILEISLTLVNECFLFILKKSSLNIRKIKQQLNFSHSHELNMTIGVIHINHKKNINYMHVPHIYLAKKCISRTFLMY